MHLTDLIKAQHRAAVFSDIRRTCDPNKSVRWILATQHQGAGKVVPLNRVGQTFPFTVKLKGTLSVVASAAIAGIAAKAAAAIVADPRMRVPSLIRMDVVSCLREPH
jgi:hypothetical protein